MKNAKQIEDALKRIAAACERFERDTTEAVERMDAAFVAFSEEINREGDKHETDK